MAHVVHQFAPSHTIVAVLRFYNGEALTPAQVERLTEEYKALNPDHVPTAGSTAKIPLLSGVEVEGMVD